jgi:hypothetical protein
MPPLCSLASREGQARGKHRERVTAEGTHVRVAELCRQPGDVVLMSQRVLHVAAPNASTTPRLMLSDFIS